MLFRSYRYYDRKYTEKTLDLDDMLVKEYFPVGVVVPAILEIYQNLLGVRFVEVKGEKLWHPGASFVQSPGKADAVELIRTRWQM